MRVLFICSLVVVTIHSRCTQLKIILSVKNVDNNCYFIFCMTSLECSNFNFSLLLKALELPASHRRTGVVLIDERTMVNSLRCSCADAD